MARFILVDHVLNSRFSPYFDSDIFNNSDKEFQGHFLPYYASEKFNTYDNIFRDRTPERQHAVESYNPKDRN